MSKASLKLGLRQNVKRSDACMTRGERVEITWPKRVFPLVALRIEAGSAVDAGKLSRHAIAYSSSSAWHSSTQRTCTVRQGFEVCDRGILPHKITGSLTACRQVPGTISGIRRNRFTINRRTCTGLSCLFPELRNETNETARRSRARVSTRSWRKPGIGACKWFGAISGTGICFRKTAVGNWGYEVRLSVSR